MRDIHGKARRNRLFRLPGFSIKRDAQGRLGFTKLHDNGHINTRAAMAEVLSHCANARWDKVEHAYFIDRLRQLRKRGTWF